MIDKFRAVKAEVDSIRDRARKINMKLSELNGVAAVIPTIKNYPLSAFRGNKVLLHNVQFDVYSGEIYAVIMLPYTGALDVRGHKIRVNINEKWFK